MDDYYTILPSKISIHALREEGDSSTFTRIMGATLFLSTPSARRATRRVVGHFGAFSNFYPRPPRGGRHVQFVHLNGLQLISIHALREEGDDMPAF